jgi:hypothetical protein
LSFLGQDNATKQLLDARPLSEVKVTEAHEAGNSVRTLGWWPQASTVARVILGVLGLIILIGWLLTLINK